MERLSRIALLVLAAGSCGEAPPHIDEAAVARIQTSHAGVAREELEAGRSLYVGRCGACHTPFHPVSRRLPEWRAELSEMGELAHLSAEDERLILLYLETFAAP